MHTFTQKFGPRPAQPTMWTQNPCSGSYHHLGGVGFLGPTRVTSGNMVQTLQSERTPSSALMPACPTQPFGQQETSTHLLTVTAPCPGPARHQAQVLLLQSELSSAPAPLQTVVSVWPGPAGGPGGFPSQFQGPVHHQGEAGDKHRLLQVPPCTAEGSTSSVPSWPPPTVGPPGSPAGPWTELEHISALGGSHTPGQGPQSPSAGHSCRGNGWGRHVDHSARSTRARLAGSPVMTPTLWG